MVNPGIVRVEDTGTRSVHRGGAGSRLLRDDWRGTAKLMKRNLLWSLKMIWQVLKILILN